MDFKDIIKKAAQVRELYSKYEHKKFGRNWTSQELVLGFVGDVGDLAKLVQAKGGARDIADSQAKLGHELADCLWSIIVLADRYDIDLESEFSLTMDELTSFLNKELAVK